MSTPMAPPEPVNHMASSNTAVRAGQCFLPWRILVGVCAVIAGGLLIKPGTVVGACQVAGQTVSGGLVGRGRSRRAWAAACAGGHTRTGRIEAPDLVTGGPYAFVRNPIYLGSFLLGLGMVGLLGDPW